MPKKSKHKELEVLTHKMKIVEKRFQYPEAFCLITYRGKGKKEVIWNSRDGQVPTIIYSRDGTQQLTRDKFADKRDILHILKEGELYFSYTTKVRARFLAKKIVRGRWNNSRYPLCQQYSSKKAAIFEIRKSLYGDGNAFTILKQGRNITTYMTKHFRGFINAR